MSPVASKRSPLVDSFGRRHRDLRLSITDRCDFRCTYCMPEEGLRWLPRQEVLTFEEVVRVASVLVERFGIDSIRLTGGEPTVRANLEDLVAMLSTLGTDLALTTNGASMDRLAEPLRRAGLARVNISLDTLRADRFVAITRRDRLANVLAGIEASLAAGFDAVKLNMVVMRDVNDDEIEDFVKFGRSSGAEVRFIEFMPLDADGRWRRNDVVSATEILQRVEAVHPLAAPVRGSAPATRYAFADGRGAVGVIPSVTEAFCGSCDRIRLTAEGALRNCLFATSETDLRALLRSGATDDELAAAVVDNVAAKWAGHGIGTVQFIRPGRSMSQIGG